MNCLVTCIEQSELLAFVLIIQDKSTHQNAGINALKIRLL